MLSYEVYQHSISPFLDDACNFQSLSIAQTHFRVPEGDQTEGTGIKELTTLLNVTRWCVLGTDVPYNRTKVNYLPVA